MKKLYIITLLGVMTSTLHLNNNLLCSEIAQPALTSEQIVEKLLKQKEIEERKDAAEEAGIDPSSVPTEVVIEEMGNIPERWRRYEKQLARTKSQWPTYQVAGNLSYLMSTDEIKQTLGEKFRQMYLNGQIISREDFEKNYNKDKWVNKGTNLTRIWGAEHLASLGENVPGYIIVLDTMDNVEVKIHLLKRCSPSQEDVLNGTIYAEKIEGKEVAKTLRGRGMQGRLLPGTPEEGPGGYTDYSGAGNIIKTTDGKLYYVDTELKSFYDGNFEKRLFSPKQSKKCEYFKQRFRLVNNLGPEGNAIFLNIPFKKNNET